MIKQKKLYFILYMISTAEYLPYETYPCYTSLLDVKGFFLYLLCNIICVEEREKLENNIFQSLQKPLVTTEYALILSLSHFKSHFHNL